jgi:mono/diheme cytochrome c family protein
MATSRISKSEQSSDFRFEMKRLLLALALPACAAILASCETALKSAPPVTAAFIRATRQKPADAQTLEAGRKVFLNRCIACHALPEVARYDAARIPRIVGWMSHRAHLSAEEQEALVKYLLAVRSTL